MNATSPTLLTTDEVAARLRASTWFVKRELAAGNLRGSKVAGHWRVSPAAVEDYLAERANVQAPTAAHRRRRRRPA